MEAERSELEAARLVSDGLILTPWRRGRKLSRLDCVQTNSRLREYYERAGYLHVRDNYLDEARHRGVALYQKQL